MGLNKNGRNYSYHDDDKSGHTQVLRIEVAAPEGRKGYAVLGTGAGYAWIKPEDVDAVCDAIREVAAATAEPVKSDPVQMLPPKAPDLNDHTFHHPDDVLIVRTKPDGPILAYGVRKAKP